MREWPLLCLLLATGLVLAADERKERKIHRLVGGHIKIVNDDAELLMATASGSRDKKQSKPEEEDRKTLSQQVADGKYGLIQKELFTKPSKRPGVLSYESNPEVPKDNINNLGGLSKNEIWLAENHLLVLKGGAYPKHDDKLDNSAPVWPPIDDYTAPNRQVKLPAHPKVPPPFPVQLTDDGPLQILGTNSSRTLNGSLLEAGYPIPPAEGYVPGTGPYFPPLYPYPPNITSGQAPVAAPPYNQQSGDYNTGAPLPPSTILNGTLPPYFGSLPPGAAILPPPGLQNYTIDQYDEDDPSIYYPPPYSFFYPKDNSTYLKAGPLVPGIILPPPPNFFGPLEENRRKPTTKKPFRHRIHTTSTPIQQIRPTTTQEPPTSVLHDKKPVKVLPVNLPSEINNELKPVITTTQAPKLITILPVRQRNRTRIAAQKKPAVTILRPVSVKTTTKPQHVYVYNNNNNEVNGKPFAIYGPPRGKSQISTTQVPLKVYYTTSNEIETNTVPQLPEKFRIAVPVKTATQKPPTQYYYYEEANQPNSVTTPRAVQQNHYYDIPKQYFVPSKPAAQQPQYIYVTSKPYNTQRPRYRFVQQPPKQTDNFSIHIAKLHKQIHQYYTTARPTYRPSNSPKPVYQYSFQAANYQPQQNQFNVPQQDPQDKFRPIPRYSVQIQQAIEIQQPTQQPTIEYQNNQQGNSGYYLNNQQNYQASTERAVPSKYYSTSRPNYDYEDAQQVKQNIATPRPITQYSFEATPNPVYQGYYTKPDEGYFDDITKKYFTQIFGKKIPSVTTPLTKAETSTSAPSPVYVQSEKLNKYQQQKRPVSLVGDTLVNYLNPRPAVNPDAEYVEVTPNKETVKVNYPQVAKFAPRPQQYVQQQVTKSRSNNNNPEIVKAIPINVPADANEGSFISYQLPGDDGAHFYFLTPQLAQRRDQGSGYYYSQPNNSRVRRNQNQKESAENDDRLIKTKNDER